MKLFFLYGFTIKVTYFNDIRNSKFTHGIIFIKVKRPTINLDKKRDGSKYKDDKYLNDIKPYGLGHITSNLPLALGLLKHKSNA